MLKSLSCALLIFCGFAFGAAAAKASDEHTCDPALSEIKPRDRAPIVRMPPVYPAQCMPSARQRETVTLKFDVTPEGQTTNIETTESTNQCLNRSAVRSIETWKYNCVPDGLKGVETLITFQLEDDASHVDFEREAGCVIFDRSKLSVDKLGENIRRGTLCLFPVAYPVNCVRRADAAEYVDLQFDVSPRGEVKNVDIVDASNSCFNDEARSSISKRKYAPSEKGYRKIGAAFFFDKAPTPKTPLCEPVAVNKGDRNKRTGKGAQPRPICIVTPAYPSHCSRRAAQKETVSFLVHVAPSGLVESLSLKQANNDCFIEPAKAAIRNYRYEPTKKGAERVEARITFNAPK